MNKKVNTLLFILGATVFNIIVAFISFISLFLLYASLIHQRLEGMDRSWVFSLLLLISIAVSFIVYRLILRHLLTKVDIEKYFDPLFVRRNIKK